MQDPTPTEVITRWHAENGHPGATDMCATELCRQVTESDKQEDIRVAVARMRVEVEWLHDRVNSLKDGPLLDSLYRCARNLSDELDRIDG